MSDPPGVAVAHGGEPPDWTPAGAQLVAANQLDDYARVAGCDVALVDAATADAVATTRRLKSRHPALQVVIVASEPLRSSVERALTFAPGIGEVWIEDPHRIDESLLRRAAEVTRQKRQYQVTRAQLEGAFSSFIPAAPAAPYISDAYLAALLQVLPDPILSIDEQDRVLSWSPAAEEWLPLGRTAPTLMLAELIRPCDPDAFMDLLARGRAGTVRGPLMWHRADRGLRSAELTVTPLSVGGRNVRAIVLRDTTDQQRAQQQLEEQAAELESQTEQLALQRDELARLAEARSRFYASMSHEIRTPINAILGYNDLLLAGVYAPLTEEQTKNLERAQAAARHLRELVDDVLDLSKIESGKVEIVAEHVAVDELVSEVVATIQPAAIGKGVQVQCALHDGLNTRTDPRRVRQILLNLLSNAVKYGESRPVHVRTGTHGDDHIFIEVRDHGRGIDAAQLERVFEEFVQLDSLAEGGTGLGLAISRRLAEALGGSLHADSRPGQGSAFTLILPLQA